MQTFMPCITFEKSAKVLDDQRLRKQLVECAQILSTLNRMRWDAQLASYVMVPPGEKLGWIHHPAVLMWKHNVGALVLYTGAISQECAVRGWRTIAANRVFHTFGTAASHSGASLPWWMGDERMHSSHRAVLLAKDPAHYCQFGWSEKPAERDENNRFPYFWPSKHNA